MKDQLNQEVEMLNHAISGYREHLDEDYAGKVMRSQLEEIGNLVEQMSSEVGPGEAISVTDPSELED